MDAEQLLYTVVDYLQVLSEYTTDQIAKFWHVQIAPTDLGGVILIAITALVVFTACALLLKSISRARIFRKGTFGKQILTIPRIDTAEILSNREGNGLWKTNSLAGALRRNNTSCSFSKLRLPTDDSNRRYSINEEFVRGKKNRTEKTRECLSELLPEVTLALDDVMSHFDVKIGIQTFRFRDAFNDYEKFGHIAIWENGAMPRSSVRRLLDFGIAWDRNSGEEVQYLMRWYPDMQLTIIEADYNSEPKRLLNIAQQEIRELFE